jgi:hypothetical protein
MKTDVLLLVDADPNFGELVALAARQGRHNVVRANTSREVFRWRNVAGISSTLQIDWILKKKQ